ncbi:MAG: aminoacyl-tRNA hydrolase [Deltaproteobacteria bacterium]|nr:aminoacyl-tRNA hydrolase [Deltaproteobacteria bacterium]
MIVIVGLGNPGEAYARTRHNIGFMTIKAWCRKLGLRLRGRRFRSRHVITVFDKKALMLFCPVTYMNNSGLAVPRSSIRATENSAQGRVRRA